MTRNRPATRSKSAPRPFTLSVDANAYRGPHGRFVIEQPHEGQRFRYLQIEGFAANDSRAFGDAPVRCTHIGETPIDDHYAALESGRYPRR